MAAEIWVPLRVREVAVFKWIATKKKKKERKEKSTFILTEKQIGGHHAQIGGFNTQKATGCVWFRITVTHRTSFFFKGGDFFGVCFLSLLFAVLRVPAGLPQSRRAHAVAKVGLCVKLGTYLWFLNHISVRFYAGVLWVSALLAWVSNCISVH